MNHNIDFSNFKNIFCDSLEALNWAYKNGLPKDSIIRTSSPKILFTYNKYVKNIEARWTERELEKFQSTIQGFSIDLYKALFKTGKFTHYECLCVSLFAVKIQNLIYKAACLTKDDLNKSRLFLNVKGKGGRKGNFMNPPWEGLLKNNPNFISLNYNLIKEGKKILNTKGVSRGVRFYIGGWETLFYRVALRLYNFLPNKFFKNKILIVNENELIIETAAFLARKGFKISKITPHKNYEKESRTADIDLIIKKSLPVINKRISEWVISDLIQNTSSEVISSLRSQLNLYYRNLNIWKTTLDKYNYRNGILLINMPTTINGISLTEVCSSRNIKVISMQHGVSKEINALHSASSATYEINSSDYHVTFNHKSSLASEKSYFALGNTFVSGISNRHLRMSSLSKRINKSTPVLYVSTNLYTANFGIINSHISDYQKAINEKNIIRNVFNKLSYKILYKAYPEENKRYPDKNPVLEEAQDSENIELFEDVVDMRYFIGNFKVFITSRATSTISWLVYSGKPVIFINWVNDNQLTPEAHESFSNGMFVFNSSSKSFYNDLLKFLSKPIKEIEFLYKQKRKARSLMLKEYFSEYNNGAGERTANSLIKKFLNK